MCTSIVSNIERTVIGFNLDLLGMEHKVVCEDDKVYIAIWDETEGWLPLFGANSRGDFIAMPTCYPYDARSDAKTDADVNVINLDIDLLLGMRTFDETRLLAETTHVSSVPGITFQAQLSDAAGNVLQITPGQGASFIERPRYSVMTNFSPFKGKSETHPWMGADRYDVAVGMLEKAEKFGVSECFEVLKAASQTVCPTVVSMVFTPDDKTVYWCLDRQYDEINKKMLEN